MDFLLLKYFIPQISFCQDRKCPKIQLIKHILIEPVSTQVKLTKNIIHTNHQYNTFNTYKLNVESLENSFELFLILCI